MFPAPRFRELFRRWSNGAASTGRSCVVLCRTADFQGFILKKKHCRRDFLSEADLLKNSFRFTEKVRCHRDILWITWFSPSTSHPSPLSALLTRIVLLSELMSLHWLILINPNAIAYNKMYILRLSKIRNGTEPLLHWHREELHFYFHLR